MNLRKTRSVLLLRRENCASISGVAAAGKQWEQPKSLSPLGQPGEINSVDRLAKRAELLSRLPAATKVETVLKVEPTESTQLDTGQTPNSATGYNYRLDVNRGDFKGNSAPMAIPSYLPGVMIFSRMIIYIVFKNNNNLVIL